MAPSGEKREISPDDKILAPRPLKKVAPNPLLHYGEPNRTSVSSILNDEPESTGELRPDQRRRHEYGDPAISRSRHGTGLGTGSATGSGIEFGTPYGTGHRQGNTGGGYPIQGYNGPVSAYETAGYRPPLYQSQEPHTAPTMGPPTRSSTFPEPPRDYTTMTPFQASRASTSSEAQGRTQLRAHLGQSAHAPHPPSSYTQPGQAFHQTPQPAQPAQYRSSYAAAPSTGLYGRTETAAGYSGYSSSPPAAGNTSYQAIGQISAGADNPSNVPSGQPASLDIQSTEAGLAALSITAPAESNPNPKARLGRRPVAPRVPTQPRPLLPNGPVPPTPKVKEKKRRSQYANNQEDMKLFGRLGKRRTTCTRKGCEGEIAEISGDYELCEEHYLATDKKEIARKRTQRWTAAKKEAQAKK